MRSRTATASRSASTSRGVARRGPAPFRGAAAGAVAAGLFLATAAASAGPGWSDLHGHLALGYAKRMNRDSPAGSLAIAAGVELPIRPSLKAGVEVGFDLLGSQVFEKGSISAQLDHDVIEALALAHWTPPRGPVALVSAGPGVFHARAGLTTVAPLSFGELPVEETAPGMGVGIAFGPRREALVKAAFEIAIRTIWLDQGAWTLALARLAVHY